MGHSAPHELRAEGVELWLRATASAVQIFRPGKCVATHARSRVVGRHTTITEHMPSSHRMHAEWTPERILGWAAVGDLRIPRRIGEDRGSVIGAVHRSPAKSWARVGAAGRRRARRNSRRPESANSRAFWSLLCREAVTIITARAPCPENGGMECVAGDGIPARELRAVSNSASFLRSMRSRAAVLRRLSSGAAPRFAPPGRGGVPHQATCSPAPGNEAGSIPRAARQVR
jgi:hypothetical protein